MRVYMRPTETKVAFEWNGKRTWRKVHVDCDGNEYIRLGSMSLYYPDSYMDVKHLPEGWRYL